MDTQESSHSLLRVIAILTCLSALSAFDQPPIQIIPPLFPSALVAGELVTVQGRASAPGIAEPQFHWSVVYGRLPSGLSLSPSGLLFGAAVETGRFSYTIRVVELGSERVITQAFSLLVAPRALTIQGFTALPAARIGRDYTFQFFAVGATGINPSFFWRATDLPAGLSLSPSTGRLSGSPASAGLFRVSVRVEQRSNVDDAVVTVAAGARVFTLPVLPAETDAFSLSPLQLQFAFSRNRTTVPAQKLNVGGLPDEGTIQAVACPISARLGPLGRPVLLVDSAAGQRSTTISVSVAFSSSAEQDLSPEPCYQPRGADPDEPAGPVVTDPTASSDIILGEIRVFSIPSGPVIDTPRARRLGTVFVPEYIVLVRLTYSEPPPIVVPRSLTFRYTPDRPDILPPPQTIPVVGRQFQNLSFAAASVIASGARRNWVRLSTTTGVTPATLTVDVDPRGLPPGRFLAMIEYRLTPPPPRGNAAAAQPHWADDAPVQRTAVVVTIGPGGSVTRLRASPKEHTIEDRAKLDEDIQTQTTSTVQTPLTLSIKPQIQNGPDGWLSTSANRVVLPREAGFKAQFNWDGLKTGDTYFGWVTIETETSADLILFTLNDKGGPNITAGSDSASFAAPVGSSEPESESVPIAAENPEPPPASGSDAGMLRAAAIDLNFADARIPFKVSTFSELNFLSVASSSGSTPAVLTLNANPAGLAVRKYTGLVTIEAPATVNQTVDIPVLFDVRPAIAQVTESAGPLIPLVLNGDGWRSFITLFNHENRPVQFPIRFQAPNPIAQIAQIRPGLLPFPFEQFGLTAEIVLNIPPRGMRTLATTGLGLLRDGWALLDTTANVTGVVILRRSLPDQPQFEAAAAIGFPVPPFSIVPFDNTNGETRLSAVNPSSSTAGVLFGVRDSAGRLLASRQYGLTRLGRLPETRLSALIPESRNLRGTVEITSLGVLAEGSNSPLVPGGPLGVLALRESAGGQLAFLPALVSEALFDRNKRRLVPFMAYGGGWETSFALANADIQESSLLLSFLRSSGSSLRLRIAGSDTPIFSTILDALGLASLQPAPIAADVVEGWGELPSSPGIAGAALLRRRSMSSFSETSIPVVIAPKSRVVLPFDNVPPITSHVVVVNPEVADTTVNVLFRDEDGAIFTSGSFPLAAKSQEVLRLPTRFTPSSGRRGIIELEAPRGVITGLVLRWQGDILLTSVPSL